MTLFGQGALQARRLVEAGCRFVTVIWDEVGQLNTGWDTHVDHYNRHLLGIDPHTTFPDRLNRPVPMVPYGEVIHDMLA